MFPVSDDISFSVLSDWIDLKGLGKLDSACVEKITRKIFLGLISHPYFKLDLRKYLYSSERMAKWIYLRQVKLKNLRLYGDCVVKIDKSQVEHLNIFNSNRIPFYSLNVVDLIHSCQKLTSIVLHNVVDINCDTFTEINGNILSQLKVIELTDCPVVFSGSSLVHFISHCQNVRKLALNSMHHLEEHNLIVMLSACPKIEHFTQCGFRVSDHLLAHLAGHCRKLTEVNLVSSTMSLGAIVHLLSRCPAMRCLTVSASVSSMKFTENYCGQQTGRLVMIRGDSVFLDRDAMWATKELVHFFTTVARLDEVVLHNVKGVTSEVLCALSARSPALRELTMDHCGQTITRTALETLLCECKQLRTLKLYKCNVVSSAELEDLFLFTPHLAPGLTTLTIRGHNTLDTEAVVRILDGRPHLRSVCFVNCARVLVPQVLFRVLKGRVATGEEETGERDLSFCL